MNQTPDIQKNIAVIGSGISGICTAYLLQKHHKVTLFEKENYFGGHTHTVTIPDGPDKGTPVDTGFIVLNERTYPNFLTFLDRLGIRKCRTDMSFGYYCKETGQCYASRNMNTLFALRKNLLDPKYWRFVYEMIKFLKGLRKSYLDNRLEDITLGDYLDQNGFHHEVIHQFVIPMASAIWSGSDMQMKAFPVRTFAQFYENHGLLAISNHPPWYFVEGGSHSYVKAFLREFSGRAVKESRIKGIKRENGSVSVFFEDNRREVFDAVVIATHADQALALLQDPGDDETRLLGAWKYSRNETFLHTDISVMPPNRRAWASWNYVREPGTDLNSPLMVTYDMTRLQKLTTTTPYFVTLNPRIPLNPDHVIMSISYTHPQFSFDAFQSQNELEKINGQNNTYFCGSYFGYGFHEDGVNSALSVGKHFGLEL